jgi:RNA polymerase sigma factor (sigma-70 family)
MKGRTAPGKPDRRIRTMTCRSPQDVELEALLGRFSAFIKMHLLKYDPGRHGLDVDDLFQEVKIKLWKVLRNERKINNLAAYIRKIVDSTVIDQLRKAKRQETIYSHEKERKITEQRMHYAFPIQQGSELKEIIARAVSGLIESRRKAVQLYLLNMSLEEIADFYSWSRDKTRNLLYRGLADLRAELRQHGIDYED